MTALLLLVLALPPSAGEIPFEITAHGHTRVDDFYWLRNIKDPAVLEYLEAENEYADSVMAASALLMDSITLEMLSRIPEEEASVPWYKNGWWYWYEYGPGQDYPVNMRRRHPDGDPEVLLDENTFARAHDYFSVGALSVSPDNTTLAWACDTTGGHWYTLVFTDIATGDTLDVISNASGDIAWSADSRMVFYGLNDPTGRTDRIMRRTPGCDDQSLVFFEEDPTFWPWVHNSGDGEWIVIGTASTLESEYHILPSYAPLDTMITVHPRTPGLEYYLYPSGSTLFILTNLHGDNYSVMRTEASQPEISSWQTVVPHDSAVLLEDLDVFDGFLAVTARTGGLKRLFIADRTTGEGRFAGLGDDAATFYTYANYSPQADSVRLVYTTMTMPWSTVAYDVQGDSIRVLKTDYAGEDYDPDLYETLRVMAPSAGGAMVPVGIVYRRDLFSPGGNPLLLYGYGAYGSSLDPSFSSSLLSLLDRGFVYAEAHVRGGSEMGRYWYHQGRTFSKMNTFADFISAADYLIEEGYCNPDRIFAQGESAGGLLIGAVVNMRHDLWRGVIAGVPFVDALTTMLDPSIPLTTNEYEEWGNPTDDPEAYQYILSYSPVDNLTRRDYPAMFVYTGINDSQVGYWEPAKWVAGIRRLNTGHRPVILRTDMGSGHGGASGRYGWLRAAAERYAFLIEQARLD